MTNLSHFTTTARHVSSLTMIVFHREWMMGYFFLLFFFLAVARNRFSFKSLIGAARAGSLTEAFSEVRAHDKRY